MGGVEGGAVEDRGERRGGLFMRREGGVKGPHAMSARVSLGAVTAGG